MSDFPTPYRVSVEPYAPTTDAGGGRVDDWGAPQERMVIGVQPAGARAGEQRIAEGREQLGVDFEVLTPCPMGGPKARWTLPSGEVAYQVGHPDDMSTGPWWGDAPAVSYLSRKLG